VIRDIVLDLLVNVVLDQLLDSPCSCAVLPWRYPWDTEVMSGDLYPKPFDPDFPIIKAEQGFEHPI